MLGKRLVKHRGDEAGLRHLSRFDRVDRVAVRERINGCEIQQILIPRFGPFVLLHPAGAGVEPAPPLPAESDEQRLDIAVIGRGHHFLQLTRGATGAG